MRKNGFKSKIIVFLCVALVFMGIGYAALQSNLNIGGTAKSSGTFDVYISNVEIDSSNKSAGANSVTGYPTYTREDATLQTTFSAPGDYITYNVTVVNGGTIDALVKATLESIDSVKDSEGHDICLYDVEYENGKKLIADGWNYYNLDAGITTVLKVTITYNEEAVDFPDKDVTFVLTLDVTQKSSPESKQEYRNFMDSRKDFEVDENGTLVGFNPTSVMDEDGYVVVGETNYEGKPIVSINSASFAAPPNVYVLSENELYIDYPRGSNEFNKVKESLAELGVEEDTTAEGTASNKNNIKANYLSNININPKLKKIDTQKFKMYGKGEIEKPTDTSQGLFVDPITGSLSSGDSSSITKLDLSNASNLETIENSTFQYSSLQSIKFPTNGKLKTIGSNAFSGLNSLSENIVLPDTITTIGDSAFKNSSVGSIILPSNLQTIGDSAFESSQLQGTLIVPKNVTSIGKKAFQKNKIEKILFESNTNLTKIDDYSFYDNQLSGTLTIPASVVSIGKDAFYGNYDGSTNRISKLLFENNSQLKTIGDWAFTFNPIVEDLIIPDGVTTIGESVFGSGSYYDTFDYTLKKLVIPSSVTSIGSNAFGIGSTDNYKIKDLSIDMETIPAGVFSNKGIEKLTIGPNVRTVQGLGYNLLTSVAIPNTVTSIGYSAFKGNQINTLSFESNSQLREIGSGAFEDNQISDTLTIPSGVNDIGANAFQNNKINNLVFENGNQIQTISTYSFYGNRLTSISIPDTVTSIGDFAFYNVDSVSLQSFTVSSNIENIGTAAFNKVINLTVDMVNVPKYFPATPTNIIFGPNVRNIADNAFGSVAGTYNYEKVVIPSNISNVSFDVFKNAKINNLEIDMENIPGGMFGTNVFAYKDITTLTLGKHVKVIGDKAFFDNPIKTINIKMTENDWNLNVSKGESWYSETPTITYNPE